MTTADTLGNGAKHANARRGALFPSSLDDLIWRPHCVGISIYLSQKIIKEEINKQVSSPEALPRAGQAAEAVFDGIPSDDYPLGRGD